MTGEELLKAGLELYGRGWVSKLSASLGISRITLWRHTKKQQVPRQVELAVERLRSAIKQQRSS